MGLLANFLVPRDLFDLLATIKPEGGEHLDESNASELWSEDTEKLAVDPSLMTDDLLNNFHEKNDCSDEDTQNDEGAKAALADLQEGSDSTSDVPSAIGNALDKNMDNMESSVLQ
ncbi:hypothetical protein HPB47_016245, partial [Ixodes persulcatus]